MSFVLFLCFVVLPSVFSIFLLSLILLCSEMSRITEQFSGKHVGCLHQGRLFSIDSYFFLNKSMGYFRKDRQTEGFEKSTSLCNEVERTQGPQKAACAGKVLHLSFETFRRGWKQESLVINWDQDKQRGFMEAEFR